MHQNEFSISWKVFSKKKPAQSSQEKVKAPPVLGAAPGHHQATSGVKSLVM